MQLCHLTDSATHVEADSERISGEQYELVEATSNLLL
jgi:hypothetical protein